MHLERRLLKRSSFNGQAFGGDIMLDNLLIEESRPRSPKTSLFDVSVTKLKNR